MSKAVMDRGLLAESTVEINAPRDEVWEALVDPDSIKRYMMGATVTSDWLEGSPITWKGEWKGKKYEDKGVILQIKPQRTLQYSHYSPMSGAPDRPESYHTVTIDLSGQGDQTKVTLTQDNNATEKAREDSEKNWTMMLQSLKKLLES